MTTLSRGRVFVLAFHISPNDARFLKLRASLESAGFAVSAAVPAQHGRASAAGVTGIDAGPRPATALGAWLWARNVARGLVACGTRAASNVIYAFDPEALPAALQLKRITRAALIYDAHEFHEDEDPGAPARGAWVRRMEAKAAPALDLFVTVNASIAGLYRTERPGFPQAMIVHNAVDAAPPEPDDGRLRAAAGVSSEHIMLYQGGLAPLRGLDRLVDAASALDERWTLVLMGEGPLAQALRERADPRRVRFLPPAPHAELAAWTRGAALGAILYEDRGRNQHFCSPNKLWEYPAAGVPVLASDLPEIARVVRGASTGWLVPADCPAGEIAACVNALATAELTRARAAAQAFANSETWSSEVAPLITWIKSMAQPA